MCRSMVDIESVAAEIRRGKKEDRRKKLQGKNIMAPLLHRAAIINDQAPHIARLFWNLTILWLSIDTEYSKAR